MNRITAAQRIRQLRLEKGFTQAEVAKLSGFSRPTVIKAEQGKAMLENALHIIWRLERIRNHDHK